MSKRIDLTEDGNVTKELLEEGTGCLLPRDGHRVRIHYVGTLEKDGTKWESTRDSNRPLDFTVGDESVICAFNLAVVTMKQHEKSKYVVHPDEGSKQS
jgi:FKBP-type peptidyl-prolyl cis-trans isomerase